MTKIKKIDENAILFEIKHAILFRVFGIKNDDSDILLNQSYRKRVIIFCI